MKKLLFSIGLLFMLTGICAAAPCDNVGHCTIQPAGSVTPGATVTLSACGTSPTLAAGSTSVAGLVTPGAGATSCTLTFGSALGPNNSVCYFNDDFPTGGGPGAPFVVDIYAKSATTVSFIIYNFSGVVTMTRTLAYSCIGF
jgi:hypothetical protein